MLTANEKLRYRTISKSDFDILIRTKNQAKKCNSANNPVILAPIPQKLLEKSIPKMAETNETDKNNNNDKAI